MKRNSNNPNECACTSCPSNLPQKKSQALSFFILALAGGILLVAVDMFGKFDFDLQSDRSLTMVFLLGLLTGAHCVGMCGGFMLSYLNYGKENGLTNVQSHMRYAVSKTLSYTILGGVFGTIGSALYFSNSLKARISIAGGIILLYLGAKAFKLLPNITKNFTSPKRFGKLKISNPIYVGLLNGLMIACGPLQAMYLIAAGVGDPIYGMLLLFVFALGTLPLFLFYGLIAGKLKRLKSKWPDRITASIVVVFGILMINRGMALGGLTFTPEILITETTASEYDSPQVISMTANKSGWGETVLYYEAGRKINWCIDVQELTLCNKTIEIPALEIKHDLVKGENSILFDPGNHSSLVYTCWMGMLQGEFRVKE